MTAPRYHPKRLARAIDKDHESKRAYARLTNYCPESIQNWTREGGQTPRCDALAELCVILAKGSKTDAAYLMAYIMGLAPRRAGL